jgi:hypothetical protein
LHSDSNIISFPPWFDPFSSSFCPIFQWWFCIPFFSMCFHVVDAVFYLSQSVLMLLMPYFHLSQSFPV